MSTFQAARTNANAYCDTPCLSCAAAFVFNFKLSNRLIVSLLFVACMLSVSIMLETQRGCVGGKSLFATRCQRYAGVWFQRRKFPFYELCFVFCVFRVFVHIRRMCGYTSICETD